MLADFVSFALYKEISLKEYPGAWFVLNTTEHSATHLYTFFFCFRYFKSDNQALQCKFVSSSM